MRKSKKNRKKNRKNIEKNIEKKHRKNTSKKYIQQIHPTNTSNKYIQQIHRTNTSNKYIEQIHRTNTSNKYIEQIHRTNTSKKHIEKTHRKNTSKKHIEKKTLKKKHWKKNIEKKTLKKKKHWKKTLQKIEKTHRKRHIEKNTSKKHIEKTHRKNTSKKHIEKTHRKNTSKKHIEKTHRKQTSKKHIEKTHRKTSKNINTHTPKHLNTRAPTHHADTHNYTPNTDTHTHTHTPTTHTRATTHTQEVVFWIILVELVLTIVWLIIRDFRLRKCILWNFLTLWNFKAVKSTSGLRCVQEQPILRSEKLRLQSLLTKLWQRDRLWSEPISLTSICLMRWLRLHWRSFSIRRYTSEKEYVSKSSVLRTPTDSYEEDKLPSWSSSISVQPQLVKRYKDSDLFKKHLQNDDVQDFDVRWDQALLSASDMPSDVILDRGFYKSKSQDSVQPQTVFALYDQETVWNNGQTSCLRLKTSVKLHIDQMMRTRNFRVRSEVVERGAVTKSHKGKKAYVERKVGECSKGDSCRSSHNKPVQADLYRSQRRKGWSSSPAPNSKAKTDEGGEKSSKTFSNKEGSSPHKTSEIPFRYIKKNPSVNFGTSRVSKLQVHTWKNMFLQTCWGWWKAQQEAKERWCKKDQLHYWMSLQNWVVYLKILIWESLFCVNLEFGDQNTLSNSSWHQKKIGKNGSIARNCPKVWTSWP